MRWCKHWNSDSKTGKKKVMEEVATLIEKEEIFPKQAVGSQLSFCRSVTPPAEYRHQVRPHWFNGILQALPKRLGAVDNHVLRLYTKAPLDPLTKWDSLVAHMRNFRWARWSFRERSKWLIKTLDLNQCKINLFHWGRKFFMTPLVQVHKSEQYVSRSAGDKEVFG